VRSRMAQGTLGLRASLLLKASAQWRSWALRASNISLSTW